MAYQSPYTNKKKVLLEDIENVTPFNYNAEADPMFQSYKKQFGELGDKALTNTMSEFSSLTGGRPSSWAVSAGQQAKSNFDTQLTDKIPQLMQMAKDMYNDNLNNKRSNFSMYDNLDNQEYGRYNDNQKFEYQQGRDNVTDSQWKQNFDYQKTTKEQKSKEEAIKSKPNYYKTGSDAIIDHEINNADELNAKLDELDKFWLSSATNWWSKNDRNKMDKNIYSNGLKEIESQINLAFDKGLITEEEGFNLFKKYGIQ